MLRTGKRAVLAMTFRCLCNYVQNHFVNNVLPTAILLQALAIIFLQDTAFAGTATIFGILTTIAILALGTGQLSPHG